MKTAFQTCLALALVAPAFAQTPAEPAPETTPPPAEAATDDASVAAIAEFRQLRQEIIQARRALRDNPEVVALRELQAAATKTNDLVTARKYSVQVRRKTEELLAAQPGMPEKLARFRELGEAMRRDLPAELRRKGKRLPRPAAPEKSDDPEKLNGDKSGE